MSAETNKAIVRRCFEQIMNNKRYDLIDEFFVETVELHGVGPGISGRTAAVEMYTTLFAAFPDWHLAIDDIFAEEDKVAVRYTATGTNQDSFQGIPATGKLYTQKAIVIYHLTNGKIVEGWVQTDMLSMMQQLGLMPAPQTA